MENDSLQNNNEPDHVEGLERVLTGINAALSRNVVSSTMARTSEEQKSLVSYRSHR